MLRTAIGLVLQLERDRALDGQTLRHRDRAIGQKLEGRQGPVRRLASWLTQVQHDDDATRADASLVAIRGVGLLLSVLGLALGAAAAAAIYFYDGSRPINILPALGTFVVLPVLLLLPLAISFLPRAATRVVPGLTGLQQTLAALGGGVVAAVTRLLPQRQRQGLEVALGRGRAELRIFGSLQKWMLLSWSQGFAVAFHVGAIAWFVARILVTDLSFTWSTTVEAITPERVHAFTQMLSVPWQGIAPEAVPSLADVEATQYFRLGQGSVAGVETESIDPAALGRWWTFLLAGMLTYGLLPRVLTAGWCAWRRARTARWTITHLPGAADVLDRLGSAMVETQSVDPDVTSEAAAGDSAEAATIEPAVSSRAVLISWSGLDVPPGALDVALREELLCDVLGRHVAGPGQSLAEDARVGEAVTVEVASLGERTFVVVAVKAWEPATMDAVDFVRELRTGLGDGTRIVVAAVHTEGPVPAARGVDQWRRRMSTIGDPWLQVVAIDLSDESQGEPR